VLDLGLRQAAVGRHRQARTTGLDQTGYFLSHYDGQILVTQGEGSLERDLWSTDGTTRLGRTGAADGFTNQRISISADERFVAQHRPDRTIEIDDLRTGAVLGLIPLGPDDPKSQFRFSGDATGCCAPSRRGSIRPTPTVSSRSPTCVARPGSRRPVVRPAGNSPRPTINGSPVLRRPAT